MSYEHVDHPQHYNNYSIEVIEMMERIWGKEATIQFCEMNAFKYRMRAGTKPTAPVERDFEKEKWYMEHANKLKSEIK